MSTIVDYLLDHAHAIDTGDSQDAAEHAKRLREAARVIETIERDWKEKCIEADTMRQHHKNAERENAALRKQNQRYQNQINNLLKPMRDRAYERAEKAELDLANTRLDLNDALNEVEQLRAEVEKWKQNWSWQAESLEKAQEDAVRLDWLDRQTIPSAVRVMELQCAKIPSARAAIDAARKEGSK